jgi:hypothetical protein
VTDEELAPQPELQDVSAYDEDLTRLVAAGYTQVAATPTQPGQFFVYGKDGAPGWAAWSYNVLVYEDPDHPLTELGWGGGSAR